MTITILSITLNYREKKEKLAEITKVIRSRRSKDRQWSKEKDKRTNNNPQSITQKTNKKNRAERDAPFTLA